jgi:hypothetical protein
VSCSVQEAEESKQVPKERGQEIESNIIGESQGPDSGFLTSALSHIFGSVTMVSYSNPEQEAW